MPINGFLYPGASGPPTPYEVANSIRFNDDDDARLSKTLGTATNRDKYTLSVWVKRSTLGANSSIFTCYGNASNQKGTIRFDSTDKISAYLLYDGGWHYVTTSAVFRDVSAWYHIVVAVDTTQSTDTNRIKLYVNGSLATIGASTYPSQNEDTWFNAATEHQIGSLIDETEDFDGYMAEFVFIDGQALDPTSFGEFDSDSPNIWKPIDVSSLTFGNNGFYLDFEDSGDLGDDESGNGNDFAETNLAATDQSTDTCTNNFATLNPLVIGNSPTLAEGNLKFSSSDANWRASASTIGFTQGKWYAEFKLDSANDYVNTGIATMSHFQQTTNVKIGYTSTSYGYDANNGSYYVGDSATSYGASLSSGDILGVALDLDNNKLYFSKNGTFQNSGDPTSGSTGTGAISITSGLEYFIATSAYGSGKGASANFGSPSFSISSGNADANGHGNFEYSVPSGYFSLCTKNLAEFG